MKTGDPGTFDPEPFAGPSKQLQSSEWFDRGWTLQELLAPRKVNFYNKHWHFIGTKSSLSGTISTRTKIAADMLCGTKTLPDYSIAQRMSWASRRVTTRDEDIAYCLLGIFDVNMPLIYGEGEKAFIVSLFLCQFQDLHHDARQSGVTCPELVVALKTSLITL